MNKIVDDTHAPRPRGRPKEFDEPGTRLSIYVPVSQYEFIQRLAAEHRMPITALVRQLIRMYTRP